MTVTVDLIAAAAQELLDASVACLETTDAGFDGVTWLSPGMPAFDRQCDFVAVWMGAENLGPTAIVPTTQLSRTGAAVNLVTLNVTTGRCLNADKMPPPLDAVTADAVKHMQDGQALWNGIRDALADGLLDGVCRRIGLLGMTAYTPQGGFAGWTLTLQAQIDGH